MRKKHILIFAAVAAIFGVAIVLASEGFFHHKPTSNVRSVDVEAHPKSICTVKVVTDDFEIIEFPELGITCFYDKYISTSGGGIGMSCLEGRHLTEKMGSKLNLPETYCE